MATVKDCEKENMERLTSNKSASDMSMFELAHNSCIKLPCKVGDTVYEANADRNIVSEFEVISIVIYSYSIQFNWQLIDGIYKNVVGFSDFDIGKTVFLTKSEAEARLKELKGWKND